MTTYLIMRADEDHLDGRWYPHGEAVEASSGRRALAAADPPLPAGVYVAIPARSWKEMTVKVEQVAKVTIG